ncbi:MAG: cytochrome bc complex cytochrome b subunit [Polyangiales bacterium]
MSTSPDNRDRALLSWLKDRYPIAQFAEWAKHKTVPIGRGAFWYYFGGITLFLFLIQVGTGIMLMFYYKGSDDTAFESVRFISAQVPFGWLIRSVHAWSANLMILSAFIHMFSVFFMRAYRKPRELTWISGMILLVILFGFGFSGYLLPWNELAFFATKVGTDIIGVVPYIGKPIMYVLRGGEDVTGSTLPRFFALHVALFPALLTTFIAVHLFFIQLQGIHEPPVWKTQPEQRKTMPFFPHFFMRELLLWLITLNILAVLAVFFPAELGVKADPFASAPAGIKPEWYFLATFEFLKYMPAHVGPIEGERFGLLLISIGGVLFALVPWIDRGRSRTLTRIIMVAGVIAIAFLSFMTYRGWAA